MIFVIIESKIRPMSANNQFRKYDFDFRFSNTFYKIIVYFPIQIDTKSEKLIRIRFRAATKSK